MSGRVLERMYERPTVVWIVGGAWFAAWAALLVLALYVLRPS